MRSTIANIYLAWYNIKCCKRFVRPVYMIGRRFIPRVIRGTKEWVEGSLPMIRC